MTRKSRREIERAVSDLGDEGEDGDNTGIMVLFEDPTTGECYRSRAGDGDPVDLEGFEGLIVMMERECVMRRDEAEAKGRDIFGPVEDGPTDAVRVRRG